MFEFIQIASTKYGYIIFLCIPSIMHHQIFLRGWTSQQLDECEWEMETNTSQWRLIPIASFLIPHSLTIGKNEDTGMGKRKMHD
jgi:hypothetical protein